MVDIVNDDKIDEAIVILNKNLQEYQTKVNEMSKIRTELLDIKSIGSQIPDGKGGTKILKTIPNRNNLPIDDRDTIRDITYKNNMAKYTALKLV